ncbi:MULTISPECIES: hypothetical protein [unclassified Peribacillus]|uniref:hypothetical protein n=1 Tax=unclassified Peribacillus TaxID=2675266 RepID=UPI001E56FB99|nr:hypothetical protein [Peribacillus sp. Bi96]
MTKSARISPEVKIDRRKVPVYLRKWRYTDETCHYFSGNGDRSTKGARISPEVKIDRRKVPVYRRK